MQNFSAFPTIWNVQCFIWNFLCQFIHRSIVHTAKLILWGLNVISLYFGEKSFVNCPHICGLCSFVKIPQILCTCIHIFIIFQSCILLHIIYYMYLNKITVYINVWGCLTNFDILWDRSRIFVFIQLWTWTEWQLRFLVFTFHILLSLKLFWLH